MHNHVSSSSGKMQANHQSNWKQHQSVADNLRLNQLDLQAFHLLPNQQHKALHLITFTQTGKYHVWWPASYFPQGLIVIFSLSILCYPSLLCLHMKMVQSYCQSLNWIRAESTVGLNQNALSSFKEDSLFSKSLKLRIHYYLCRIRKS